MNNSLLQIDVSKSYLDPKEEDIIDIRLSNGDHLQVQYSKLVNQSKYVRDEYKYSEAVNSFQTEIDKLEKDFKINDESIQLFIQLIQEEKVFIPIDHYRNFCTLSEYFCIPRFTRALDNIMQHSLYNDLNFTIQILIDSESSTNDIEMKLSSKIETFLSSRINECIKNQKFHELPVTTILRIINKSDKEKLDTDWLIDFIFESVETRFILLKFVRLHKLTDDKMNEFIKILKKQEEETREMYMEYMFFDFLFIMQREEKYDNLFKLFNQTKQELNQTKQELDKCKSELNQSKDVSNGKKNDNKQCAQPIIVGGYDNCNELGEKPNNKNKSEYPIISPPVKSPLDPSSLLSYSVYLRHSVLVMSDGSLKGIGDNSDGRISATLQKTVIKDFTDFCIKDGRGRQLTAVSAVCSNYGTLYMFSKIGGSGRQLVLCDSLINEGDPVFLDIGNQNPVSLFGGCLHSAAIGSEGEVIFINRNSVKNSPKSPIAAFSLPDGEKASSVACCKDSVVVLSSNGRVFLSPIESNGVLKFSIVPELSDQDIVCVSGTYEHCLAVSKEGRVFGLGSNSYGQLGLGKGTKSVSSFTKIPSLFEYEIRAVYAGCSHSLFETREGKILSCGSNYFNQLLLSRGPSEKVYSPTETTITSGASFCIAGNGQSAVFIGSEPPPNTPNTLCFYDEFVFSVLQWYQNLI